MIVFLKRLMGIELEQKRQGKRFRENLNGFDLKQKKLDALEGQLQEIVVSVEEQQGSIRARPSSAMSGEHSLNLAVGGDLAEDAT